MRALVDRLRQRHLARAAIRAWFDAQGFLEVEPPTLVPTPGLEPAITAISLMVDEGPSGRRRRYLHTSPEFAMKRMLAQGAERIYSLGRVYRAGERGPHHRPEFTMLEWYRLHAGFQTLMDDCEGFLRAASQAVGGQTLNGVDLGASFERLSMAEAFHRHAGVDLLRFIDPLDGRGLQQAARQSGLSVIDGPSDEDPHTAFERAFYEIMLARVEPQLGRLRPTFVYHWPTPLAALARVSPSDGRVAERVELYAGGLELGNGFGELVDPVEQERRFREEQARRRATHRPVYAMDRAFLRALGQIPAAAGMAVGFDRVVMLLTGAQDIAETLALD